MGTSNFLKKDSSAYYVVSPEERDDVIDIVYEELESLKKKTKEYEIGLYVGDDDYTYRNYFGESIGEISVTIHFYFAGKNGELGDTLSADINVYMRSGYYEGYNLDYEVRIKDEIYGEIENEDELMEAIEYIKEEYESELTHESKKRLPVVVIKRYQKLVEIKDEIVEKIEEILEKYSEPYNLCVQFDNGETIYAAAKPKKKQKTAKMGV